jgi:hypothetical protein
MGEMENQAEFYYEKLKISVNPGQVLLEFYREMLGKDAGRSEIIMINRLVKMFGRFTVYFGIMDLSKYQSDQLNGNLYPLLYTICKGRFEKIHVETFSVSHESLDKYLKEIQKEREKAQRSNKGKLPTSEGL